MEYLAKLGLVFIAILCLISEIDCQDVCDKKGPCTCVFPNGTGIDLTPVATLKFFSDIIYSENSDGIELSTYYYHPCYDMLLPDAMNVTGNNNTCDKSLTICRHVYTLVPSTTINSTYTKDAGIFSGMGNANNSIFSVNGDIIIYENGPSKTKVHLVCAETEAKFHVNSIAEPNDIELALYSRFACLKTLNLPTEGGRSLGSTLLIVFFSLTLFYLVLGISTKKFLMGATGIEVIPNLAFWSDLPNLVKDGWAFAIAGFKLPVRGSGPAMSPDPNSYDSI